jgi:hypothetical protein
MRFRTSLIAAVAVLAAAQVSAQGFKAFTSPPGRFTINGPGTPQEKSSDVKTAAGTVKLHQFVFTSGARAFIASYTDYPSSPPKGGEAKMLKSAEDGFVRNVQGTVTRAKAIKLGAHPGREFDLKTANNLEMSARIYLVGPRLYQVVVGSPVGQHGPTETKAFLDSFRLTK